METGERLSAYLAGELDADETAAVEADLASDPSLRAKLDRIQAANEALASLPQVAPSAEFSARLRETLRQDIDQHRAVAPPVDDLARKRLQRNAGTNRFIGLGVAAAAVTVVAGVGLSNLFGASDGDPIAGAGDDAASTAAAPAEDPLAPFIRVTDTDHDAESVAALADEEGLLEIPATVGREQAQALEEDRYPAFGLSGQGSAPLSADSMDRADVDAQDGGGEMTTEEAPEPAGAPGPAERNTLESAPADPFNDVRRCLPEIVETANQPVIPLFAEVAAYEGEPAIIYLVLTREPDARVFNRIEAWVVARADCFPLNFQQVSR